jgi:hypothetical protein
MRLKILLGLFIPIICHAEEYLTLPSSESLLGGFGGGPQAVIYYQPSLSQFNSYLKNNGFEPIDSLFGMGGTGRWCFNQNYQIGITGVGFWGSSGRIDTTLGTPSVKEASIGGGYCMLLGVYRIPLGRWWAVSLGAGIGRIGAEYELLISNKNDGGNVKYIKVKGWDWMYQIFVECSYRIRGVFGVGFDIVYISGDIDNIRRGGELIADSSLPKIDLSGVMIRIGPRFHF